MLLRTSVSVQTGIEGDAGNNILTGDQLMWTNTDNYGFKLEFKVRYKYILQYNLYRPTVTYNKVTYNNFNLYVKRYFGTSRAFSAFDAI